MDVDPGAAVVRQERPSDEPCVVEDTDRVDLRVHAGQAEVGRQVLALPHREPDVVPLADVGERDDVVDVVERESSDRASFELR
jgi:hypothetical protein